MRIALYVDNGLEQIVLTPETDTERSILDKLHASDRTLSVHKGEFYTCNGGFVRHGQTQTSTILVLYRK